MPRNINDILKSLGENARRSPARGEALKSEILSKVPVASTIPAANRSSRRLPWLSFALTGLAVLTLFLSTEKINYTSQSLMTPLRSGVAEDRGMGGAFSMPNSIAQDSRKESVMPWPVPPQGTPITDNREFLKTDYSANIRTRRVQDMAARIQTIVRGMSGRVDSASSSPSNGYLSFVIPANKLEAFKNEIRSLTRAKFYSEQISAQNLLPQKQSIEEQQRQAETTLSGLYVDRDNLTRDHNRIVSSYQSRINAINKEITALNAEWQIATPQRQAEIVFRIVQLEGEKKTVSSNLAGENKNYQTQAGLLDAQIKNAEAGLEQIKQQDQDLLDNVATVQGYISLSWISIWEIMDLYLPGPLLAWMFLAAAMAAYFYHSRRSQIFPL